MILIGNLTKENPYLQFFHFQSLLLLQFNCLLSNFLHFFFMLKVILFRSSGVYSEMFMVTIIFKKLWTLKASKWQTQEHKNYK